MDPIWRIFNMRKTEKHKMKWMKEAIKAMKKEGLIFEKVLGHGAFGDVVKVRETEKKFAVKIIRKSMTWEGEINTWKDLKHPNILPLVRLIRLPELDLFVMPLHKKTLNKVVQEKKFLKRPDAFAITKKWMAEVGSGLNFMHKKGIAHLDLKSDNVLISEEMHAIICDFSCINVTGDNIDRYGLTAYYKPPEANRNRPSGADVEGASFDTWSFGLLGLYLWSGQWFESQVGCVQSWTYDVYPLLFQALQHDHFHKLLVKTFPRSSVTGEDGDLVLNFVQSTLRYHRQDRPDIGMVLGHGLWTGENQKILSPDPMWTYKNSFSEYPSHKNKEKSDIEGCVGDIHGSPSSNRNISAVVEGACIDTKNEVPLSEKCVAPAVYSENIEGPFREDEDNISFIAHFSEVFGVTADTPFEGSTGSGPGGVNWAMNQGDKEDRNLQITSKYDIKDEAETVVKDTIQVPQPCIPKAHPETALADENMEGQSCEAFENIVTTQENDECTASAHVPHKERKLRGIKDFFLSTWDWLNPRSGKQKLK